MKRMALLLIAVFCLPSAFAESKRHGFFEPGERLRHLPPHHRRLEHDDRAYYFFGGNFFLRDRDHYRAVRPPRGLHLPHLPPGYIPHLWNDRQYYYHNNIWYLWDEHSGDYFVTDPPPGSRESMPAAGAFSELYVYPASGQSPRQQDRDYRDCHLSAVEESGFDPDRRGQNPYLSRDYRRAMIECLDNRGYTVR